MRARGASMICGVEGGGDWNESIELWMVVVVVGACSLIGIMHRVSVRGVHEGGGVTALVRFEGGETGPNRQDAHGPVGCVVWDWIDLD